MVEKEKGPNQNEVGMQNPHPSENQALRGAGGGGGGNGRKVILTSPPRCDAAGAVSRFEAAAHTVSSDPPNSLLPQPTDAAV
jgi:hypothetical protein